MDLNSLKDQPLTFENVLAMLQGASPEVIKEIEAKTAHLRKLPWLPQVGPQTAAFDSPADETLYGGAAGGGKLLNINTFLPTPSGFVRMGDVAAGDTLFDETGAPCHVTVVSPLVETPKSYRLTFDDGSEIEACADHLWLTYDVKELAALTRRDPDWKARRRAARPSRAKGNKSEAFRLSISARNSRDAVGAPLPSGSVRTTQEIVDTLRVRGRTNHAVPVAGSLDLPHAQLPVDPYVLGVWLGDGSRGSGGITGIDLDIFDHVEAAGFSVTHSTKDAKHHYAKGLVPYLRAAGVLNDKHVPAIYLRASSAQRRALLQGLMDTDGHAALDGACEFDNTNRRLIDAVYELVCSLGMKASITEGRAKLYGKDCGARRRVKFMAQGEVFRLQRKQSRLKTTLRRTNRFRYIVEAELIEPVPMRCIAVDSPSRLYLAGKSFIPTHNTDLLLGLATTKHQRTVIFRSQSVDLVALWERLQEIIPNPAKSDSQRKSMRLKDGRVIETGHLDVPGSERGWMGRAHDLIGFDEAALLHELKVNFVTQWLRSKDPAQRCRVVFATNPPLPEINADGSVSDTAVGDWLLRWFAPWVDDTFAHPAKEGELRWCFMKQEGDRLTTIWVDGPGCYDPETGAPRPNATKEDINKGKVAVAKSRTFIRSLVSDNIFYANSGYAERLSAMPEPMKSMLLKGDFTIKGMDHPFQIIPTEWVLRAQARWAERSWKGDLENCRQLVLYGDIAQGGADTTVLSPLYETDFFEELITAPGAQTPTGIQVQTMVLTEREDDSIVALDGTGGWAGSTRDLLSTNQGIECEMHIASVCDGSWDSKNLYKFTNLRAKMWWEFREALSPKSGYDICLPPSSRLRAQLTAPQYRVKGKELWVESKDDIRKRIGSSTDEADAVLGAWQYRDQAISRIMSPSNDIVERLNGRAGPALEKKRERLQDSHDNYDPRGEW